MRSKERRLEVRDWNSRWNMSWNSRWNVRWNNQFPETKILGLPVSQRMRGLVYLESRGVFRGEVDVNTFHKDIQYALERLGKSKFGFERTAVIKF